MTNNRIKKTSWQVLIVMLAAIALVSVLAWFAAAPLREKSGFTRKFILTVSQPLQVAPKDPWTWSISGLNKKDFFIQGRQPNQVIRVSRDFRHLDTLILPVTPDDAILSNFELLVDSSWVWLFAKNVPAITSINMDTPNFAIQKRFPAGNYTRIVKTGPATFVFRGFDTSVHSPDQIFLKSNIYSGYLQREKGISEKHRDAGLSTDGLLHFDSATHLLSYVFFYKNRFLCLDTNLTVRYTGYTVDTLNSLQTLGGSVKEGGNISYTNIAPSRIVNQENCVADGKLYNYSVVKADNQSISDFVHNAVIDVYNLRDGHYAGSFYIPDYEGEKLQQFRVSGNIVLVLYKHFMATYQLPTYAIKT